MEKIANNIAGSIASELKLDKQKEEVIAYGTFALLQIIISITSVIAFGIIFNCVAEALIISFTTSFLRKYSGGVHASTPKLCTIIGTFICIVQAILIKYLIVKYIDIKLVIILTLIAGVISSYIIHKNAPVDNINKPIKKNEKRKRMKKASLLVLSSYLVIAFMGYLIYIHNYNKLIYTYAICVTGGTLWQVFTLTKAAHLIFRRADTFFKYIEKG